ncbi:hypothetical protein BKA69DRAFT_1086476 [Paraphysoderma sedebokerense]|nr:hypothetical protein BKA69DRAFT_1086476 [Paraphysoderma sedebokerense]
MNDYPFWHNMPQLREVEFRSQNCDRVVGEARVSSDLLAKLKRFSATVRRVQLPKSLPSTLEHLELNYCEYVENPEALFTCRHSLKLDRTHFETQPTLHSSLTHLWVHTLSIQNPELPPSLISLTCINGFLVERLPPRLQYLECTHHYIQTLPPLPSGLRYLDCSKNDLTSIGNLPSSLEVLICRANRLTSLPALPPSLKMLCCSENPLADYFSSSNLERLPPLLKALDVNNGTIHKGFKPALPSGLLYFNCSVNHLSSIPLLPPLLEHLVCCDNKLQSLPPLPMSLEILDCCDNNLTCLPTLPKSIRSIQAGSDVSIPPLPSLIPLPFFMLTYLKTGAWRNEENWKNIYTKI